MKMDRFNKMLDPLASQVTILAEEYSTLEQDLREQFDEKSERWQESADGEDWQQMCDEIGELAARLEDVAEFRL